MRSSSSAEMARFCPPSTISSVRLPARACSRRYCSIDRSSSALLSRSEEHTSELQSLMRISYAVFCLKKKKIHNNNTQEQRTIARTFNYVHVKQAVKTQQQYQTYI